MTDMTSWNADDWHLLLSQYLDSRANFPNGLATVALLVADCMEALRTGGLAQVRQDLEKIADVIEPHWRGAGLNLTADWIIDQFIRLGDAVDAQASWPSIDTYPNDNSVVLVANPDEGTLPVIAWKVEDKWFEYDLTEREPLDPQPTIWMAWPKMPKASQVSSTHQRCAKCGCETKGEAALVDGKIWCHPCADMVPSTLRGSGK